MKFIAAAVVALGLVGATSGEAEAAYYLSKSEACNMSRSAVKRDYGITNWGRCYAGRGYPKRTHVMFTTVRYGPGGRYALGFRIRANSQSWWWKETYDGLFDNC